MEVEEEIMKVKNIQQQRGSSDEVLEQEKDEELREEEEGFDKCVYITNFRRLVGALKRGKGVVKVRFPPEPSGLLHLGHVKALEINHQTALYYSGKWILRFDDSNPKTINPFNYIQIMKDLNWLGYVPDLITKTSDYFPLLFACAIHLIKHDLAYVCHEKSKETESQKEKFQAGDSPYRNRLVEENRIEFLRMFTGEYEPGEAVLRLKYKTVSGIKDPVIYRVSKVPHCVTGLFWNIYPTYDYCHPICDSIEGIGLSLCSEEFKSHRKLYEWILTKLKMTVPDQREFPRLTFPHNITSKRLIRELVEMEAIKKEDDPRLLTVSGLRRRGFTPSSLRSFISSSSGQLSHLHDVIRENFGKSCKRRMIIMDRMVCRVHNFESYINTLPQDADGITVHIGEQPTVTFLAPNHPIDMNKGQRELILRDEIWINKFDFSKDGTKCKHYLTLIQGVCLKYTSTLMTVDRLDGKELLVNLYYQPTKMKKTKAISWLSEGTKATLNLFDDILAAKNIDPEVPLSVQINFKSFLQQEILIEKCVTEEIQFETRFQFNQTFQAERIGYLTADEEGTSSHPSFNVTSFLKLHPDMLANIKATCKLKH